MKKIEQSLKTPLRANMYEQYMYVTNDKLFKKKKKTLSGVMAWSEII